MCAHNVCVVSSRLFVGHHQISLHDVMTQGGSPGSVSTVHVGEAYFFFFYVKVVGGVWKTIE